LVPAKHLFSGDEVRDVRRSEFDCFWQVEIQTRQFNRVGEQQNRQFDGKLIAATNRDLLRQVEVGGFRQDLYYRLCGNVIRTPSLMEQIQDAPDELQHSIRFIVSQISPIEMESITDEVISWIDHHMPDNYEWPGNFRELEQCVRSVIVHNRHEFSTPGKPAQTGYLLHAAKQMESLNLAAEQLLGIYCTWAYWRTGNFEQAAAALKLDRRTIRSKLEEALLAQLKNQRAE
jgi:DNA-binding NtrC family response regulator